MRGNGGRQISNLFTLFPSLFGFRSGNYGELVSCLDIDGNYLLLTFARDYAYSRDFNTSDSNREVGNLIWFQNLNRR